MSPSDQVYIPFVFDPLVVSTVPKDSPPSQPLQIYSHRQTSHCPLDDCLLVPTPPPAPAPIVEPDLPIVMVYSLLVISFNIILF